jgi:hypothetical protein
LASALAGGCSIQPKPPLQSGAFPLRAAEAIIDAFYSFDPARLHRAMSDAPGSFPQILYYQGWAQGGNYVVLERRPCRFEKEDEVRCEITVRDDLIAALRTGYDVTDTFHLSVENGRLAKVRTSSNDPPEFERALDWLRGQRPELFTGPCRGFFAGGPTPQDCVRAVVRGFADFAERPS